MNALTRCLETYWSSSIGKKLVVALTGIVLVLFLAGHLVGNLVVFMGPEPFNQYAYFLHHMLHGMGIWVFRIVMLVMVTAHIVATICPHPPEPRRPPGLRIQGHHPGLQILADHDPLRPHHPRLRDLPHAAFHRPHRE